MNRNETGVAKRAARLGAALVAGALAACGGGFDYPPTEKGEVVETLHGVEIEDPCRWFEDDAAPEVLAWVDSQNEVTFGHLRSLPEREAILARLTGLRDHARRSAPFRFGENWFVRANAGLPDQDVLYRVEGPGEDPTGWVVLFDADGPAREATIWPTPVIEAAIRGG